MLTQIVVVYDNDTVTIKDNGKVVASGDTRMFHKMAQNVIDNADKNGYNVVETSSVDSHRRALTLVPKETK